MISFPREGNVERTDKLLHEEPTATHWCVQGEVAQTHSRQDFQPHSRSWDWQTGSVCIPLGPLCHFLKPEGKTHPALLALLPVEHPELEGGSHVCQLHQDMVPICHHPQLGGGQGSCQHRDHHYHPETALKSPLLPRQERERGCCHQWNDINLQEWLVASLGQKPLCSSLCVQTQEQNFSRRGTMAGIANGNLARAELHRTWKALKFLQWRSCLRVPREQLQQNQLGHRSWDTRSGQLLCSWAWARLWHTEQEMRNHCFSWEFWQLLKGEGKSIMSLRIIQMNPDFLLVPAWF